MADSPWGGSENLWAQAAFQALHRGHKVLTSVYKWEPTPPQIAELEIQGAIIHRRKHFNLSSKIAAKAANKIQRTYLSSYEIKKTLHDFQPDLICISQGGNYDIIQEPSLFSAIKEVGSDYFIIPQFNYEHYTLPYNEFVLGRKIFGNAKGICFVSERNREVSRRQLALPLHSSTVIFNPPNIQYFQLIEYPSTGDGYQFACVSRLDCNYKGQDILLEVLSGTVWKDRKWKLSFYGQGEHEEYLRELVRFYQLETRVTFKGHTSNISEVWTHNHLLIMPSIAEGTPSSLVEAMICGRTAIATDVGGNAAFVREGETGFLVEAPTATYLSRALERAWSSREQWKVLGQAAHRLAVNQVPESPGDQLLDYLLHS